MIENDVCVGKPLVAFSGAKATIEALTGLAAGSMGYASDTHAPGWLIDDTWSWLDITKGKTLTVTGSPTIAGDATLTLTTALTNQGGAGVLAWPVGGATLTIPETGTAALLATANVFTTNQKVNCNSTTALLVEQDGVKDNVLVVDTANGYVGINKIPSAALDIAGNGVYIFRETDNTYAPTFFGCKKRTASALTTGDYLFQLSGYGWTGANYQQGGAIAIVAAGTFSGTSSPGLIYFQTAPVDSVTPTTRMTIASNGSITINQSLLADADFLVNGDTYALIQTDASDDELYLCNHASAKFSIHGVAPVVQQVLATGAGATADDIITFLQLVGLCKQA